jgi:FecR protein
MAFKWFTGFISGLALVGMTLSGTLRASAEQAPDGNGPGVARVSVIQGSAVIQRGDSNTQTTAVINAPLLPGDYVSTGGTSRAELQFDGETAVRLGGNVQARITDNDPNNRALQLADGTVEIGIVHGDQPFQVDTPSVSVRAQDQGDYRITINRDGSSWVTARRGSAEVITPQRTYDLTSGRTLVARGSAENPSIGYRSEVGFDSFDDFNAKRDDTMMAALNASPNLSPTIAGYDNLDQYGNWQDVAGYGQVWVPDEPADWAPYRDGSWAWEGGYGWTWVGTEPWGWAPYHYGRWFWANGYGWAWYPPAYSYAPVWSPALVGFYGWGGGVGIGVGIGFGGFGFGGIGWCPLAPFEAFYPWYPGWTWGGGGWGYRPWGYGGFRGGTRVVNITNIHNVYRNFGHGGGSGTLRGNFEHGNFSHNVAVTSQNAGRVGTIRGALPVTPSKENLGFGRTPSRAVSFSKSFDSPRFASNRALASHNSFAEQQRSVAGAIHGNAARATAPVSHESEPNDSWQRFDESRGSSHNSAASERSAQNERASSASEGSREERPSSNSWSRYSSERGNSSAPAAYGERERGAYSHSSYPSSYSRSSYPSYSHSSYPSSYSRSSYPSYSHSSYPSYSHASSGSSRPSGGGGPGHGGGRPPR